jgi:hypothetical protein
MDTRIEELASIIVERCQSISKPYVYDDRYETYTDIQHRAVDILRMLAAYRQRNPQEY